MEADRKTIYLWSLEFLVLMAVLLLLFYRSEERRSWETLAGRVDALRSESFPPKASGSNENAWEEYDLAIAKVLSTRDDENGSIYFRFAILDEDGNRTEVERMVAGHAAAIRHLQLGAQRADGQYPYDWSSGGASRMPSLLGSRKLANLAVAQAKLWTAGGRAQDAAGLLLDVARFGRDLSTNGPMFSDVIGWAVYVTAFDGFRDLLLSGELSQEQLAEFAHRLEGVERAIPSRDVTFLHESLDAGTSLMHLASQGVGSPFWWDQVKGGDWPYALAVHRTAGSTFAQVDGFMQRARQLDAMKYADARREWAAISAEVAASPNAMLGDVMPYLSWPYLISRRDVLARLRLLRTAAAFLADGEMLSLEDPFGNKLCSRQDAGAITIWSLGDDGSDHKGVGSWSRPRPDMVLEIPK